MLCLSWDFAEILEVLVSLNSTIEVDLPRSGSEISLRWIVFSGVSVSGS